MNQHTPAAPLRAGVESHIFNTVGSGVAWKAVVAEVRSLYNFPADACYGANYGKFIHFSGTSFAFQSFQLDLGLYLDDPEIQLKTKRPCDARRSLAPMSGATALACNSAVGI